MKFSDIPEQYVRTRADKKFLDTGGQFDPKRGERVVQFVEKYMRTTRGFGAGRPVTLFDYQRDFLIPLFAYHHPNGVRRFRESLFACPRQNGKSFLSSAIALYMLVADD